MNKPQDYASDSDESDEDFCPANVNEEADSGDEEEEDEEELEDDSESEEEDNKTKAAKGKVREKRKSVEKQENSGRSTRQTEAKQNARESGEKDELESDEEADKSRSDALWADFLGDVGVESKPKPKETPTSPAKPVEKAKNTSAVEMSAKTTSSSSSASSAKENQQHTARVATKRAANGGGVGVGGGLGSLLNQLGKKKKVSVLEKSQQDWKSFKSDEGIDEELRTHNMGKDGYLERQDFLQRTDLRQFEIEKSMRQSRRQN